MPATSLFVGNLPYTATEQDLRDLFSQQGLAVAAVRLVTDLDSGRSRGYAFVETGSAEDARHAIETLHNATVGGRTIVVNEARSRGRRG